jgi:hypothetical protein
VIHYEIGFQFFTVPIHTSPTYAVREIDALVDVFDQSVEIFQVADGIVMGVSKKMLKFNSAAYFSCYYSPANFFNIIAKQTAVIYQCALIRKYLVNKDII